MINRSSFLSITTALLLAPHLASAHEHQKFEIGDKTYDFTVGSMNEPVVVDDKSGVEFAVWTVGTGGTVVDPVTGLEATLKVEVSANGKTKMMDLAAAWGEPGSYHAVFYPTVEAEYSYRFVGTVNEVPVDLKFTCNAAGHDMHGNDVNTTRVRISDGVTRIEQRGRFGCPKAKEAMGFPEPANTVSNLHSSARLGTVLGAAGLAVSLLALATSRRKRS